MSRQAQDVELRLLAHRAIDVATGCWCWNGRLDCYGYGQIKLHRRNWLVHRIAYEQWRGPIPGGLTLDHLCRNRACFNLEHMEVVTPRTNTLRGIGLAALNARKTHCVHGHTFTSSNTYWVQRSNGRLARYCRTC